MNIRKLDYDFTVCKIKDVTSIDVSREFYFIGKTDDEISLVCLTEDTPVDTIAREDEWKGFCIEGILDFSLIGILSPITKLLADNQIGIFAVSTYNTDYILVKSKNYEKALDLLSTSGYTIT